MAKGIIPVADAPVINQRTLTERIRLYNFVHGNILSELALLLSLRHNLPQQLVIDSVMVEQVLFSRGNQLRGIKPCRQIKGNAVINHQKHLPIQIHQLLKAVHFGVKRRNQLLIFIIK